MGAGTLFDLCAESAVGSPQAFKLALCNQSSLRYKEDVSEFNPGLSVVTRLRPVTFRWKERSGTELGLVAEEVAKIEPQITFSNASGEVEGVKYDRIGVVLINAVKEQQAQIETQQKQIDEQKATIDALTKLVCATNMGAEICATEMRKEK